MGDQWFRPRVISECHSNNRGSKHTVSVECIGFKAGETPLHYTKTKGTPILYLFAMNGSCWLTDIIYT